MKAIRASGIKILSLKKLYCHNGGTAFSLIYRVVIFLKAKT